MHATCVALDGHAALLVGPPGAGKSDLALRLISSPVLQAGSLRSVELVADDQVLIGVHDQQLIVEPPQAIAGRLEVRGVGILQVPHVRRAVARLVVDLTPGQFIERLPDPGETRVVAGRALPLMRVDAFAASAPVKVALRLLHLTAG
jgi:HPr kinase/phosphorylase